MYKNILKYPKKLCPGDTIGIISPAGVVKDDCFWSSTVNFFENYGYKVKIAANAINKNGYLAGKDEERLYDLNEFWEDDEIKAIICSRGGYGCHRLLDKIDYEKMTFNPKIFIGYSDITALLSAFLTHSKITVFHGPLALSDFGCEDTDEYTITNFFNILEGKAKLPFTYQNPLNYQCIKEGTSEGELIGGNLTVLSALLGTPYFPEVKGKILFLEDIAEPVYKIDRMISQLKLAGVFEEISGLLFSEFTLIPDSDDENLLINTIKYLSKDFDFPIGYGFPSGHGKVKATLPLGIRYSFSSLHGNLTILDKYLC